MLRASVEEIIRVQEDANRFTSRRQAKGRIVFRKSFHGTTGLSSNVSVFVFHWMSCTHFEGPRRKITAAGDFRVKIKDRRAGTGPCSLLLVILTFGMANTYALTERFS